MARETHVEPRRAPFRFCESNREHAPGVFGAQHTVEGVFIVERDGSVWLPIPMWQQEAEFKQVERI
jgi:hypothetical protein